MVAEQAAFGLFIEDGAARIARVRAAALSPRVPGAFRAAAASVAQQAEGGWSITRCEGDAFKANVAMRNLEIGEAFPKQCARVGEIVTGSENPELRAALAKLGNSAETLAAIMATFFHYFVAHEFVHVAQGLGSDQYRDSDFYMSIVMEADYVADVAGLVIAIAANVPELTRLTSYQQVILLIAIHIASMHSFAPSRCERRSGPIARCLSRQRESGLDADTFSRLLIWYLHFARLTKARLCPEFDSPAFMRSWIVTLPRLVGASDRHITLAGIAKRARKPFPAASDVVLSFHRDDGIYGIVRAAFTDLDRTRRLACSVLQEEFDAVRAELEELLVYNPAIIPAARERNVGVELLTTAVIETLESARAQVSADDGEAAAKCHAQAGEEFARLGVTLRAEAARSPDLAALIDSWPAPYAELEAILVDPAGNLSSAGKVLRRLVSIVDQIAVYTEGPAD